MRHFSLILTVLALFTLSAQAQEKARFRQRIQPSVGSAKTDTIAPAYAYSHTTQPYTPLANDTLLLADDIEWDDENYQIPLGFHFPLKETNAKTDTLYMFANDWLDGAFFPYNPNDFETVQTDILLINTVDMVARVDFLGNVHSRVSYKTEGQSGSRICKIQYDNIGLYADTIGLDSFSYQLWFHENGTYEIHYGPSAIDPDLVLNGEIFLGYFLDYSIADDIFSGGYLIDGDPAQGVFGFVDPMTLDFPMVSTWPEEGFVASFSLQTPAGVAPLTSTGFSLAPNPARGYTTLTSTTGGEATITDLTGRTLLHNPLVTGSNILNISSLQAGMYLVRVTTPAGTATRTLILE